jgi:efflux ABC transporter, permease protein
VNLLENIKMALWNVRANKVRSVLTMLGIVIGIAAVISILSVGDAMTAKVNDTLNSFGTTNIVAYVMPRQEDNGGSGAEMKTSDRISLEQITDLKEKLGDNIRGIGFTVSAPGYVAKYKTKESNVMTIGVDSDYPKINTVKMIQGRFINSSDENGNKSFVVVSDKLVKNLFNSDNNRAMGAKISIEGGEEGSESYQIIGIYRYEKPPSLFGGSANVSDKDLTTNAYVPYTTALELSTDEEAGTFTDIMISAKNSESVSKVEKEAKRYFLEQYRSNTDWKVETQAVQSALEESNSMMKMLSLAIAVIGGISLLVGGIGVMNIMLVSVTERTREIGVRKALGATNNNIRLQFITESMIVCMIGGIIGVLIGGGFGYFASSFIHEAKFPSLTSVLVSVSFSMAIGIFFGYYPANKAAKLDPIDALRYE